MTGGSPAGGAPPRRPGGPGARIAGSGRTAAILCLLAALGAGACGGDARSRRGGTAGDGNGTAAADTSGGEARSAPEMTEVNRFLSYSAADSLVDLKLWAGLGGANSAWNFDGYYAGNATVVVPAGWRVEVTYQTLDANVPHSAAVVEPREELPTSGSEVRLAFPGASTPSFTTGLTSTHPQVEFAFRADEPGRYWILCGVPGHARGGMWIWFEVSASGEAPDFRTGGEG